MIWQLIKRDFGWTVGMGMTAVVFALTALDAFLFGQPHDEVFRAAFLVGATYSMGMLVVLTYSMQSQNSKYHAALPIAGRDLWLSQVLSLLSLIWLPALWMPITGGFPPLSLFEAAAISTVVILGVKCFRIGELGAPQWLRNAGFQVVALGPAVVFFSKRLKVGQWLPLPPATGVLAICGLASVTMFWWGWSSVPKSLQIAPPGSGVVLRREASGPSKFIWSPVFRSIYGRPMMFVVFFLLWNIVFFRFLGAANLIIGTTQVRMRSQSRWLLALPFPPRRLFRWIAIPPTVAIIVACLASILIDTEHPLSATGRWVEIAAQLAVLYGLMFLSELPAWSRLSKLRATRLGVWILWTPFVIGAFAPIFALPDRNAIQHLAGALPASWWQFGAILTAPVIATYWLAEKAFGEQEYRQLLIETGNLGDLRRNSI